MKPKARTALETIYRELAGEIRELGVRCEARGVCCDFGRVSHILFASSVEIEYAREIHPQFFESGSRLCPFWIDGLCSNHERRPLGCRTYFCDERYRDALEALYEKYYRRVRALADLHDLPWRYEPFVDALRRPDGESP